MNLSNLKPGQQGKILKLDSNIGPIRRRLMDMGVIPGESIKVEKVAPMGDPIEVTVKSYNLSLRKNEAKGIEIEVLPWASRNHWLSPLPVTPMPVNPP